jgi:hypothetical protein
VIGKAEWTGGEANPRFVVTSLGTAEAEARHLYEHIYCARGEMENRIKECQLDLFADRTSAATMRANQLRLATMPLLASPGGEATSRGPSVLREAIPGPKTPKNPKKCLLRIVAPDYSGFRIYRTGLCGFAAGGDDHRSVGRQHLPELRVDR